MKNIIDYARTRYATKRYDKNKPISAETMEKIRQLLRLSPSSVNVQPWHFIMAVTEAGKARLIKSTEEGHQPNTIKIAAAPLTIVFCARVKAEAGFLGHITEQEAKEGRFPNGDVRVIDDNTRKAFVNLHKSLGDVPVWTAKQVYLNLGFFLLGVAALGLDASPMEGFEKDTLNKELGLTARGLDAVCMVSVGYHAEEDLNIRRPKSRLPEAEIIEEI